MATKDGTQTQEGVETSPGNEGTSQGGLSPELQKAIDAIEEKVRSDSLAEIGRVRESAKEGIRKATEAASARYKELLAKQQEGFEGLLADQPDALTTIRERHKALLAEDEKAQIKADLDVANARLAEADRKEKESEQTRLIQRIATSLGVDSVTLSKRAKYSDGSKEQIEDIAKDLPKLSGDTPGGGKPDSTQSRGGGGKGLTKEDVAKMPPDEQRRRQKEIAAIPF